MQADWEKVSNVNVWMLMSGGIDSTACAHYFLQRGDSVTGLFVDYGQPAVHRERQAAERIANHLKLPLSVMSFRCDRRVGAGELTGRNAFLIFAALMGAHPTDGLLSLGLHSGTTYYDCGPAFVEQVGLIVEAYSDGRLALHCPFLLHDKALVYEYARIEGLPLNLTYSCELGTVPPCGRCASCLERNGLIAS